MHLPGIVKSKRKVIVDRWMDLALQVYPQDSARFMRQERDRFGNPVGRITREALEAVFEGLVTGRAIEDMRGSLDEILRLRAVQDMPPLPGGRIRFLAQARDPSRARRRSGKADAPNDCGGFVRSSRHDQLAAGAKDDEVVSHVDAGSDAAQTPLEPEGHRGRAGRRGSGARHVRARATPTASDRMRMRIDRMRRLRSSLRFIAAPARGGISISANGRRLATGAFSPTPARRWSTSQAMPARRSSSRCEAHVEALTVPSVLGLQSVLETSVTGHACEGGGNMYGRRRLFHTRAALAAWVLLIASSLLLSGAVEARPSGTPSDPSSPLAVEAVGFQPAATATVTPADTATSTPTNTPAATVAPTPTRCPSWWQIRMHVFPDDVGSSGDPTIQGCDGYYTDTDQMVGAYCKLDSAWVVVYPAGQPANLLDSYVMQRHDTRLDMGHSFYLCEPPPYEVQIMTTNMRCRRLCPNFPSVYTLEQSDFDRSMGGRYVSVVWPFARYSLAPSPTPGTVATPTLYSPTVAATPSTRASSTATTLVTPVATASRTPMPTMSTGPSTPTGTPTPTSGPRTATPTAPPGVWLPYAADGASTD